MKYLLPILLLLPAFSACQSGEKKKDNDNDNKQKQFIEPPKHNKDTGQVYLHYPYVQDANPSKS